jgi:hypothetical protein
VDIGVLGWWHHDNEGDRAILENVTRALAPHCIVPIDLPFPFHEDWLRRLNLLDFVLLGGGGLFQDVPPPPFDTFDLWRGRLETPIGVAGVGIDTIPDGCRKLMSALLSQACFFYVRDRASQQLLGQPQGAADVRSEVQVAPDLSFLYPLDNPVDRHRSPANPLLCGVNLRQVPGLEVGRWLEALRGLPLRFRGIPLSTYDVWREVQTLRQLDDGCATAFDPALYDGLDLMVGTAFHSVLFAIQAGVPVIAIAYAPKVRRVMTEVGLEEYLLEPDQWARLPELVEQVREERDQLVETLRKNTRAMTGAAQRAMADVREKIEAAAASHPRPGPRASIVVVGSPSEAANRTTIASCMDQTYGDVEVVFIGDVDGRQAAAGGHPKGALSEGSVPPTRELKIVPGRSAESLGERLNRAFAHATGEYLSWTLGGNLYARDAMACMVDCLVQETGQDMVYTDYYSMHNPLLIAHIHPAFPSNRLFRRNTVGPCFLYRRKLAEAVGPYSAEAPLVDYEYWLRAHVSGRLEPLHLPLGYVLVSNLNAADGQTERQVRRQWRRTDDFRSNSSWPVRVFWRLVDNDLVEGALVRPLLSALRRTRAFVHDFSVRISRNHENRES